MNGSDGTADLPIDNLEPCFHLDRVILKPAGQNKFDDQF